MTTTKKIIPAWGKEAKKALIDRDMSIAQLAAELDLSRSYVSNVINGSFNYPEAKEKICDYTQTEYRDCSGSSFRMCYASFCLYRLQRK